MGNSTPKTIILTGFALPATKLPREKHELNNKKGPDRGQFAAECAARSRPRIYRSSECK